MTPKEVRVYADAVIEKEKTGQPIRSMSLLPCNHLFRGKDNKLSAKVVLPGMVVRKVQFEFCSESKSFATSLIKFLSFQPLFEKGIIERDFLSIHINKVFL